MITIFDQELYQQALAQEREMRRQKANKSAKTMGKKTTTTPKRRGDGLAAAQDIAAGASKNAVRKAKRYGKKLAPPAATATTDTQNTTSTPATIVAQVEQVQRWQKRGRQGHRLLKIATPILVILVLVTCLKALRSANR
jgi:hypothetical protein